MQELQVINQWDLTTFQTKLRTLEVVHHDNFGVINFSKYSAKNRTRFNPRTTTLAIRRQTHEHMDDTISECDTLDTATDQLQSRRQNNDKYDKKKGFSKVDQLKIIGKHDSKHYLEDNLYKKLPLKNKIQYVKLLNKEEYERCGILKEKFKTQFLSTHPKANIGRLLSKDKQ